MTTPTKSKNETLIRTKPNDNPVILICQLAKGSHACCGGTKGLSLLLKPWPSNFNAVLIPHLFGLNGSNVSTAITNQAVMSLSTPLLFIIFRRPALTARVFERIRKAQPTKLYIAIDGLLNRTSSL